jgi:hypothetical protein
MTPANPLKQANTAWCVLINHRLPAGESPALARVGPPDGRGPLRPGGMAASRLRGETNEISCAKDMELRDNDSNPGGLAIWDGTGRMDLNDQFEAEGIAAVSQAGYFALQKLVNRALFRSPIRHDTIC